MVDLKAQTACLKEEVHTAIEQVMNDASFANGPMVRKFEMEFASYCQTKECVAVNSGTSALHLAMCCLDVGPGDEVITVSMSFIATAWPCLYLGARPVFVDIDPVRYTMDPNLLVKAITPRTKAIVVVHLYGQCADMDSIMEIADARGIPVIEDTAHAAGAMCKNRPAGSMGTIGCFSFYPTKNLGTMGEGGALTFNDTELADRARVLRNHGQKQQYVHDCCGFNYRMSGFQGAILSIKLKHLDKWNDRRREIAAEYGRALSSCNFVTPQAAPDSGHIYHLYVIRDSQRDELRNSLEQAGIMTGLHYPIPIHLQKPFQQFGYGEGDLPVTEELAQTCLSLPIYPEMKDEQLQRVVTATHEVRLGTND